MGQDTERLRAHAEQLDRLATTRRRTVALLQAARSLCEVAALLTAEARDLRRRMPAKQAGGPVETALR